MSSVSVETLEGVKSGVWLVSTENSQYVLDLDKMKGKRLPGEGENVNSLRADGKWFSMHSVYCEVGPCMTIICMGIAKDDVYTLRQTTQVRRIEKVEKNG